MIYFWEKNDKKSSAAKFHGRNIQRWKDLKWERKEACKQIHVEEIKETKWEENIRNKKVCEEKLHKQVVFLLDL